MREGAGGYDIRVGEHTFAIPDRSAKVPGLLWETLAVAALLDHAGYEEIALDELAKVSAWLRRPVVVAPPKPAKPTTMRQVLACLGKQPYESHAEAHRSITRMSGRPSWRGQTKGRQLVVYHCVHCSKHHVGSQPR